MEFALCYSYLSSKVKHEKQHMAQKLISFFCCTLDKEKYISAMFILGSFKLSVHSLVSVSRGSVQECTGPVDSKAPA